MKPAVIDNDRLASVTRLLKGGHVENAESAMCVMEAVAYVTREPWSDHPKCACPVLTAFLIAWNDGIETDEERNRLLLPLIPRLANTRSTKAVERKRAVMAADWLIRVHTPAWLRLAKLDEQAGALEAIPEITDFKQYPSLMPTLKAVRSDAAAAGAAAGDAAWAAARAAAWAAARAAARAAAGAAARAAAWDAARAAARAAAWDALKITKEELQQSAVRLVERMIEVQP
jgi:hypothetical protein